MINVCNLSFCETVIAEWKPSLAEIEEKATDWQVSWMRDKRRDQGGRNAIRVHCCG
jgi:hypothetical protein